MGRHCTTPVAESMVRAARFFARGVLSLRVSSRTRTDGMAQRKKAKTPTRKKRVAKKTTTRKPPVAKKKTRKRPGRKPGFSNLVDNEDLIDFLTWRYAGKSRWGIKKLARQWIEENEPTRPRPDGKTIETLVNLARDAWLTWFNKFRADQQAQLERLTMEIATDPNTEQRVRLIALSQQADLVGVGAKYGTSDNMGSPEAKAARARAAIQEMKDKVTKVKQPPKGEDDASDETESDSEGD